MAVQESDFYLTDTLETPNMISVRAAGYRLHLAREARVLQAGIDAAQSANAKDSITKMLAHQLAAVI